MHVPEAGAVAFEIARSVSCAITRETAEAREHDGVQAELAQALRWREQRMAILAHDLRNPLNALTALSTAFSRRRGMPQDVVSGLQMMSQAAWRMNELIETLIGFSAARFGGSIPVSPAPTDLYEVTRAAVDELRYATPQRRVSLDTVGDTRGTWDPARMAQVLSNLVGNALTHGTGSVDVSLEGRQGAVSVAVSNQGPLIPAEIVPTIFEPFRRCAASDGVPRGLGLGLYVSKQIVLAHGGTIDVDSTAERGTVFTVHLPRDARR